jgi:hypothetical protein
MRNPLAMATAYPRMPDRSKPEMRSQLCAINNAARRPLTAGGVLANRAATIGKTLNTRNS